VTNTDDTNRYRLTDAQVAEVARIQRGLSEGWGKLATEEQMAVLWTSCGLPPELPKKTK
jgi:hypothetical protein